MFLFVGFFRECGGWSLKVTCSAIVIRAHPRTRARVERRAQDWRFDPLRTSVKINITKGPLRVRV